MQSTKRQIRRVPATAVKRYIRANFPTPFSRWMQLLLGLVFLFAAFAKSVDLVRFGRQTEAIIATLGFERSPLLGAISLTLAIVLILVELYLGASLTTGYRSKASSQLTALLLIAFSALALWLYISQSEVDCGCFGPMVTRSARDALAGDVLLLVMAVIGAISKQATNNLRKTTYSIVITGLVLTGALTYYPISSASLREGSPLTRGKVISFGGTPSTRYIWVFNTDCSTCQKMTSTMNMIAASAPDCFIGVTSSKKGKISEFTYDYNPTFPITTISEEEYRNLGLQDGTLLRIGSGVIDRLWSPYNLQPIMQLGFAK